MSDVETTAGADAPADTETTKVVEAATPAEVTGTAEAPAAEEAAPAGGDLRPKRRRPPPSAT